MDVSIGLRGPSSARANDRITYDININNFGNTQANRFRMTIDYDRNKLGVADFQAQSGTRDWYTNDSRPGSAIIEMIDLRGRESRTHRLTFVVASTVRPGDETRFRGRYPRFGRNNENMVNTNEIRLSFRTLQALVFEPPLTPDDLPVITLEPLEDAFDPRDLLETVAAGGNPRFIPTVTPTAPIGP